MLVRKFEADNLDEALKAVKVELGPDAIILKTVTNNGLKGAFKKKRIEITAAISEQNYQTKAKVDKVLDHNQKENFYKRPASELKESFQSYNSKQKPTKVLTDSNYGGMGLNKVVNTLVKSTNGLSDITQKTGSFLKNSFDDFLTAGDEEDFEVDTLDDSIQQIHQKENSDKKSFKYKNKAEKIDNPDRLLEEHNDHFAQSSQHQLRSVSKELYDELKQELKTTQNKLSLLEQKLTEVSKNVHPTSNDSHEVEGLNQLKTTLKTLDVSDVHILDLIKKATYDLSPEQLNDFDTTIEYALKKMTNAINISSSHESAKNTSHPKVTVLLSEGAVGQTSISRKLAIQNKNTSIIHFGRDSQSDVFEEQKSFSVHAFEIQVDEVRQFSEMIGLSRKYLEKKNSVIIDLKVGSKIKDESKKFIETLKRSFKNVEVLGTISAIHAEVFNRKLMTRYQDLLDGVVITHLDLCMSYGALFNIHLSHNHIPLKYFGTGPSIPDDIENATAERLMAGLFQL